MHPEAREWVARHAYPADRVLEIGSRNINGSNRDLFPSTSFYWGIDIVAGPGVDEVAAAETWRPAKPFDLVICTEVLEHAAEWPGIVRTAAEALRPGGHCIITTAAPPRKPHGMSGGPHPRGEYYRNLFPFALASELDRWFADWTLDRLRSPGDLRVWATK